MKTRKQKEIDELKNNSNNKSRTHRSAASRIFRGFFARGTAVGISLFVKNRNQDEEKEKFGMSKVSHTFIRCCDDVLLKMKSLRVRSRSRSSKTLFNASNGFQEIIRCVRSSHSVGNERGKRNRRHNLVHANIKTTATTLSGMTKHFCVEPHSKEKIKVEKIFAIMKNK